MSDNQVQSRPNQTLSYLIQEWEQCVVPPFDELFVLVTTAKAADGTLDPRTSFLKSCNAHTAKGVMEVI